MASYPPEVSAKIQIWRAKASKGTLSLEEMKEAVQDLRNFRKAVEVAELEPKVKAVKKSTKKLVVSGEDLLSELDL